MLNAALFDMDGLLLDSENVYAIGLKEVGRELGYTITDEVLALTIGADQATIDACFGRDNPTYDGDTMRRALGVWLRRNGYDQKMPLKPYALEILQNLTARGVQCALVTNTSRTIAEPYMRNVGMWTFFGATVTGDLGLPGKPAPDVYLRAAKLLGVSIARCAVVEDSYNGLRAGRAAGAVTIMVPDMIPYGSQIAPCCDYVAPTLREAEAFICR